MAKDEQKSKSEQLIDKVHDAVRDAIDAIPELREVDERAYCELVLEGIDCYVAGINMRLEELCAEAEDDEADEYEVDDEDEEE